MTEDIQGILLNGIDGGNLLGFLAAVGTLRVVTESDRSQNWTLGWRVHRGTWVPVLVGDEVLTQGELIETLTIGLKVMDNNPAFQIANNLSIHPDEFRGINEKAYHETTIEDRQYADFIAAFGCESVATPDKKSIQDTALRTMNGAGHQHFIGYMKDLVEKTDAGHLRSALFDLWQYSDNRPSLRWDPRDDRRYALRYGNPGDTSKNPIKTVRGANRLAVEALPLFPTAPEGRQLRTTGFTQRRGIGVWFTWPIWESQLGLDVIRSLLSLPQLQATQPDRGRLLSMGVVDIYRSQRFTTGRFRNFSPAQPV